MVPSAADQGASLDVGGEAANDHVAVVVACIFWRSWLQGQFSVILNVWQSVGGATDETLFFLDTNLSGGMRELTSLLELPYPISPVQESAGACHSDPP